MPDPELVRVPHIDIASYATPLGNNGGLLAIDVEGNNPLILAGDIIEQDDMRWRIIDGLTCSGHTRYRVVRMTAEGRASALADKTIVPYPGRPARVLAGTP